MGLMDLGTQGHEDMGMQLCGAHGCGDTVTWGHGDMVAWGTWMCRHKDMGTWGTRMWGHGDMGHMDVGTQGHTDMGTWGHMSTRAQEQAQACSDKGHTHIGTWGHRHGDAVTWGTWTQ